MAKRYLLPWCFCVSPSLPDVLRALDFGENVLLCRLLATMARVEAPKRNYCRIAYRMIQNCLHEGRRTLQCHAHLQQNGIASIRRQYSNTPLKWWLPRLHQGIPEERDGKLNVEFIVTVPILNFRKRIGWWTYFLFYRKEMWKRTHVSWAFHRSAVPSTSREDYQHSYDRFLEVLIIWFCELLPYVCGPHSLSVILTGFISTSKGWKKMGETGSQSKTHTSALGSGIKNRKLALRKRLTIESPQFCQGC